MGFFQPNSADSPARSEMWDIARKDQAVRPSLQGSSVSRVPSLTSRFPTGVCIPIKGSHTDVGAAEEMLENV